MRARLLFILMFLFGISSFAQKMAGFGGELSILSLKPNYRIWISRATGFEVFAGQALNLADFKPTEVEAGFKYLHTIIYDREVRTYFGIVGKWKWINIYDVNKKANLPVPGLLFGREWYIKHIRTNGLAIELGIQYGSKEYQTFSPINHLPIGKENFNEIPVILNLRYTFYKRK